MKKIVLRKKTKIYILAPTNSSTGGPECLHQLALNLKDIYKIHNVYMVYLPLINSNPIHKNYKKYNINFTNVIEDNIDNLLIIPEHYMFLNYALKYKKIKKVIWWLSVDNYFGFKFKNENHKFIRSIIKIPFNIISVFNFLTNYRYGILTIQEYLKFYYKRINLSEQKELKQASFNFMQSHYAFEFFKKKLKNIKILYDYLNQNITRGSKSKKYYKKNLICYSHKSNRFIEILKKETNNKFIKLQNLNQQQIINIFKKTKIYIDFGFHPGKDKMPREAVLFNNCIITNKKGSAKNSFDIPIKEKYKFFESQKNLVFIKKMINDIFNNYQKELKNFEKYKLKIISEKKVFRKNLKNIFLKK